LSGGRSVAERVSFHNAPCDAGPAAEEMIDRLQRQLSEARAALADLREAEAERRAAERDAAARQVEGLLDYGRRLGDERTELKLRLRAAQRVAKRGPMGDVREALGLDRESGEPRDG
jgi:CRP-like cAMP-binding protein